MSFKRTNDSSGGHQPVQPDRPSVGDASGPCAQGWSAFCQRLEKAGHMILAKEGVEHPLLQAETLRFFVRELQAALTWEVDCADPDSPHFWIADQSGSGPPGPNADNSYLWSRVRGDASYRVTLDTRNLYDMLIGVTDEKWTNYGDYAFDHFDIGPDGMLEITVSPERQPGNWLEMPPAGSMLAIRVYYHDWSRDSLPTATIERIGGELHRPAPIDPDTLLQRLEAANLWLETRPYLYPVFQERAMDRVPANTITPPVALPGGGSIIQYGFGRLRLEPDQALIIECDAPQARYWGFHVYTAPWFSQVDIGNRLTSLNNQQLHIDEDGKVRLVVSHGDPGVHNWLDAGDLPTAAVFYRWIWSEDTPVPESRLVPLAEVRAHLPPTTPVCAPQQRAQQMRERRRHLATRYRY